MSALLTSVAIRTAATTPNTVHDCANAPVTAAMNRAMSAYKLLSCCRAPIRDLSEEE